MNIVGLTLPAAYPSTFGRDSFEKSHGQRWPQITPSNVLVMDSSHTCRRSLGHTSDTRTQAPKCYIWPPTRAEGLSTLECDRECRAAGARAREPPPCACARPPEWGRWIRPRPACPMLSAAATALGTSASACLARLCCIPSRHEPAQPAHGSRDRANATGLHQPSSETCLEPSAASCGAV